MAEKKETTADKIKRLREEADTLEKEQVDNLLAEINAKVEELNSFGHNYHLTEESPVTASKQAPKQGRMGRPKGFKMSSEQKERMKQGRAKARADREAQLQLPQ